MPKYIPNKTAEIEEIQNAEIRRLTKGLERIMNARINYEDFMGEVERLQDIACETIHPERKP